MMNLSPIHTYTSYRDDTPLKELVLKITIIYKVIHFRKMVKSIR